MYSCLRLIGSTVVTAILMAMIAMDPDPAFTSDSGLVVVANKNNQVSSLTKSEVKKIFLGKKRFWNTGVSVETCDLVETGVRSSKTARARFSRQFLGKDLVKLKSYWIRMIFSGRGHPPVSFDNAGDVIKFVARDEGGIGYLYPADVTDDVKTLTITNDGE